MLRHYLDEGLSKTAIARKLGVSRRTVQRLARSGKQEPSYGPRPPAGSQLDSYKTYLRERLAHYPELTGVQLLAELRERGYPGGYTLLKDYLRTQRPAPPLALDKRFEVEPGKQAQVDFATFKTDFGAIYALLVVLSWSRTLWVRFGFQQDQLTVSAACTRRSSALAACPARCCSNRLLQTGTRRYPRFQRRSPFLLVVLKEGYAAFFLQHSPDATSECCDNPCFRASERRLVSPNRQKSASTHSRRCNPGCSSGMLADRTI